MPDFPRGIKTIKKRKILCDIIAAAEFRLSFDCTTSLYALLKVCSNYLHYKSLKH